MIDIHFDQFAEWFDVLAVTHRLNAREDLRQKMRGEYFAVLKPYSIESVTYAYESLRRKMKKWPVPADWLEALPPTSSVDRLPAATADEIAEAEEAERLCYEQPKICQCELCVEAQCHMPPRYVPRLDRDGHTLDRRHPGRSGAPVLLGEWLHGLRLRSWYAARGQFYELKAKLDADQKAVKAMAPEERMAHLIQQSRAAIAQTT